MKKSRAAAFIAYLIPVLGWLYVWLAERKDGFAIFHLKQAISLVLSMIGMTALWVVVGWLLTWIPYGFVISVALFALLIPVYIFGFVAWITGMSNALRGRFAALPIVGGLLDRSAARPRLARKPARAHAAS